jgi:hypothetical protein
MTAFINHVQDSKFFVHIIVSIQRIMIGFAMATIIGVIIGTLMGRSKIARDVVTPYIEVLRPIPAFVGGSSKLEIAARSEGKSVVTFYWGIAGAVEVEVKAGPFAKLVKLGGSRSYCAVFQPRMGEARLGWASRAMGGRGSLLDGLAAWRLVRASCWSRGRRLQVHRRATLAVDRPSAGSSTSRSRSSSRSTSRSRRRLVAPRCCREQEGLMPPAGTGCASSPSAGLGQQPIARVLVAPFGSPLQPSTPACSRSRARSRPAS